ncbi:UDP-2,4-diacetamido-2,4,6-trideoxy-beta-L-altropyranose hydrolase [Clostridium diolis]|uniref:UDP-2,4-diacetamido-2,4, 6-trideoxy-beta-L-altropyranose hydrolase n=1 Tax=Clostridium diolis TaxID=223919 RepID=UPI003AF9B464
MKIAIRADGGTDIGMGHIMRTLVLAKELNEYLNNEVFYICKIEDRYFNDVLQNFNSAINSKYIKGIKKILDEGFKVEFIRENKLIKDLKNICADIFITDSYDVNEKYFDVLKNNFAKTVYIDDMNLYYFNVDYLINQNIDAEDFEYKVNEDTRLILGTKYLMLRDEFKNISSKNIKEKVSDIMITVGGADSYELTEKILSCIKELKYNFHIIIGPLFKNTEFIYKFQNPNIIFYENADMCEIMKRCDIAISACGSTLYELAACGVPTLGIIIADNQQGIAKKMDEVGIVRNLGRCEKLNKDIIIDNINTLADNHELRKTISKQCMNLVDGKGAKRIASILIGNS